MGSNLVRRTGAAFTFVPIFSALIWWGGLPLLTVIALIVGVGTWELFRLYEHKGFRPFIWPGILMSVSICTWVQVLGVRHFEHLLMLCTLGVLGVALFRRTEGASLQDAGATLFGVLYVGFLGSSILMVRNLPLPHAAPLSLTLMASIWVMDAFAYFAGWGFGRTRPFHRVSPNKSIEGCVAGVFGAIGTVWLGNLWIQALLWGDILFIGFLVGIGGQVGDFAESLLKRDSGLKDASAVLPGHGGVLDRFDSALFACPLVYTFLVFRYEL